MQFVGDGQPWSRQQSIQFIQRAIDSFQQRKYCQWAMELKLESNCIGYCGLVPFDTGPDSESKVAEIGWRIARSQWGRGLATEAARSVLDYGFNELRLERILATVQLHNRASQRVAEKLGMIRQKTILRNHREVLLFEISGDNGTFYQAGPGC